MADGASGTATAVSTGGGRGRWRGLTPLLAAALLAGAISGGAGETTHRRFQPSEEASSQRFQFAELNRQTGRANALNGAAVYGTLGALLGLALGATGGLLRGRGRSAALGGLVGLIAGAAAGALPAFPVMPWQWAHRHDDPTSATLLPVLVHAALWCGLGGAAGLAYALGRRGGGPAPARGFVGGLAGAAAGSLLFEVVVAVGFPTVRTDEPFPTTALTRFLPHLFVALGTAAGAWGAVGRDPAVKPAPLEAI